jgi:hypothetical protein
MCKLSFIELLFTEALVTTSEFDSDVEAKGKMANPGLDHFLPLLPVNLLLS